MKNELNPIKKGFLLTLFLFCSNLFPQESNNLYASIEDSNVVILEPSYTSSRTNKEFEKKYHYLVARAYFKLLAEAQKSERKLRIEFERYSFENEKFERTGNQMFQNKFDLAFTRYKAHNAMLSGLKSWNLFSEDRTGDMYYFMAENEDFIFKMYKGKLPEDKMIKYLIYKLADLYHVDGEN